MKKKNDSTNSAAARRPKVPPGWNEQRVQSALAHYEGQTEEEAVAEDEAAFEAEGQTVMIVPTELVPEIRQLIGRRRGA
jgi:hypothetical protein